jgi:hypothetical protein
MAGHQERSGAGTDHASISLGEVLAQDGLREPVQLQPCWSIRAREL